MTEVAATSAPDRGAVRPDGDPRHALSGVWRNQLGSELVLHADGFGGLTGSFRPAGGPSTVGGHGVWGTYDTGATGDMVLSFTVKWPETHALTVWVGHRRVAEGTIQTTWLMVTDIRPEDEWRGTMLGHDVFQRIAPD